jgi:hypothetical protein
MTYTDILWMTTSYQPCRMGWQRHIIPTCTFTSINCKNTQNRLKNNNFRIILIIIICLILTHFFVLDRYGRRLGMITRLIWKRSFFNLYIAWLCIVQKVCVPVSMILVCIDKRSSNFCCMEICCTGSIL